MTRKYFLSVVLLSIVLGACKKHDDNSSRNIDVSQQWQIDFSGQLVQGYADGQWESKTFSNEEMALFDGLANVSLAGTSKPATVSVKGSPGYNTYIYPNPFYTSFSLGFRFTDGYNGSFVAKLVITDDQMNIVYSNSYLQHATYNSQFPGYGSDGGYISVPPGLTAGQYRLYFTLSTQGDPHFYRSWGNIQQM